MESERSTPSQTNELDARTMPRVWPISGGSPVSPSNRRYPRKLAPAYPIWSSVRRSVDTLVSEQCPGDAGCLIGHGRPARRLSAAAPGAGRSSRDACPAWRVASAARFAHHARASALCSHPRASISAPACPCRHSSVVGARDRARAESCRPERNCAPSPIVATSAVAVMTPTPGIVARRRLAWLGSVPSQKRRLQLLDPGLSRTEAAQPGSRAPRAPEGAVAHHPRIFDDGNQFLHPRRPLSDDQSELRTVAAQRIDHHGALTDQQLTGPVQHQNRLLLGAFRRCKAHRRTRHRLADRFPHPPRRSCSS